MPPFYHISLGSIRPPTQGIPSVLSQGRNRRQCAIARLQKHTALLVGEGFSQEERRERKRKWINTQRKIMGKLKMQVLPLFLILTLLRKEIHGFTLPQASKEKNKESLTEAMVIHFVTSVYDWCRQCENIDRIGLFSFLCRQQSSAISPEKIN